ncbi:hypothetical protein XA68_10494 [Ophiocordyceps unilateralis]|uniref:Uncharacterized protein n=1 Tax=Ophiocordyceps unilateralis TaxID=268505 RepID=A0A2A9P2Q3_OPHUN|nr:hypothetical protein XA68_10494 [Ophiocordyceps unilateralis]
MRAHRARRGWNSSRLESGTSMITGAGTVIVSLLSVQQLPRVDELSQSDGSDVTQRRQFQSSELHGRQIHVAKGNHVGDLHQRVHGLQRQQRVDVKDVAGKHVGEDGQIDMVVESEALEGVQVERVDALQVVEVLLRKHQTVEAARVESAPRLQSRRPAHHGLRSRRRLTQGSKGTEDESPDLHFVEID